MSTLTKSDIVTYSAEAAGDGGALRCQIVRRVLGLDGRAHYSIVVFNETEADAHAHAFAFASAGQATRTIFQSVVGPQSDLMVGAVLDPLPSGRVPYLDVVVSAANVGFTLSVPALSIDVDALDDAGPGRLLQPRPIAPITTSTAEPPRPLALRTVTVTEPDAGSSQARYSPPIVPVVATFAAILAGSGLILIRPQVDAPVLPDFARAGATVSIGYHAQGWGQADFAVLRADGTRLAAGPLHLGDGRFVVALPPQTGTTSYLVRIAMGGLLGTASAEDYLHVASLATTRGQAALRKPARASVPAPLPAVPPQIRSLALDRAAVGGGEQLTVYYDTQGASGTVALLDPASQIVYDRQALSAVGHTTFTAPHTDTPRLLQVVLTAVRGGAQAQSRVGVTVTPASPAPDASAALDATAPSQAGREAVIAPLDIPAAATALSAPESVKAGQAIHLEIRGAAAGLQIRLLDGDGSELTRRTLRSGQTAADFTAPPVSAPTRCLFEATYPHGAGSETVIRAITVDP